MQNSLETISNSTISKTAEAVSHTQDITMLALVAGVAVLSGLLLTRLRQPPLVGYILAGIILGPTGFGMIEHSTQIATLAELGVVMLLFVIGMELSLRAFILVLRPAILTALGQICIALLLSLITGTIFGWSLSTIILFGFAFALSSTAVTIAVLSDLGEMRTRLGQITIGVMIAQDIALAPMLIIINTLGSNSSGFDSSVLMLLLLKITAAILLLAGFIWYFGRRSKISLPFTNVVKNNVGLLTLSMLAFCFTSAAIAGFSGLSAAYGAFLAGLVIANSTLRSQAIHAAEPVQSVLLVAFFLSIGLLIDLNFIWQHFQIILGVTFIGLSIKSLLNVSLLRMIGEPWERAFPAGLIMAQIGEFSFILAALGVTLAVISPIEHQFAISVIALSLIFSPFWSSIIKRFHETAMDGVDSIKDAIAVAYDEEAKGLNTRKRRLKVAAKLAKRGMKRRRAQRQVSTNESSRTPADMGDTR